MKKFFSRLTEDMSPQARSGLLIATLIAVVHFAAVPYYLYLSRALGVFQLSLLAYITIALGIGFAVSIALIKRGKPTAGMILVLGLLAVAYPPVSAFLVSGLGLVLGIALAIVGPVSAFQSLPKKTARLMAALTLTSGLVTVLLDIFGSDARPPLQGLFIQLLASAVVLLLGYLVIQRAWSGNIRIKLVTSFTVIALITLAIVGTVVYISYRNQVVADMRQRLINVASITATQIDGDAHATIRGPEDMAGKPYRDLLAQFRKIIATDPDLRYIYTARMNDQGQIYFIIDGRQASDPEVVDVGTLYEQPSELLLTNFNTLDHPIAEPQILTDEYGSFLSVYAPFYKADGSLEGIVGADIVADKVMAQQRAVLSRILGTALGTMVIVTLIGLLLGNMFVGPIVNLSIVAKKITAGDLGARAKIETTDEVGELAKDLNLMTSQLQSTLQGLEQRVADRTRNLELAAEVGRSVSQVRNLDVMLKDACELILKEFNLYYVQVYLADPSQTTLRLEAGTGVVAEQLLQRGHSLPLNANSINGRAAVEKHSVVISDTTQNTTFRQNPLLPDTRGEMAMPLIVANKVVGVLDMQSSESGVLTQEIRPAFEALAGQLAVAIQNANLLAETEQARAEVEKQARHLVRTGWNEHLDAIHMPEQLGFVFNRDKVTQLADFDDAQFPYAENAISAPIAVAGETLGSLLVELHDDARREQTSELVKVVAQQVSQQIENLRLLNSAERYRHEAEEASRRLTREGWESYAERASGNLSYAYDLKEVRLQNEDGNQVVEATGYTLPLKVRDEVIGRLVVQGLEAGDGESLELANAVADRLSAHIESLRQFDETKNSQIELEKRAKQLAAVAEVSTLSTAILDPVQVLQSVVDLTKERFNLYHAHVYLLTESGDSLRLAAGAGEVGRQMVAEGWQIPADHQDSIVARAARTRQSVISNEIVHEKDSEFLSNRLLPNTRSEMAVPLMVGDNILGVFDVQADRINAFSEEDANIQTTLASQVATSLQNARSFAQAQKQAERESKLNVISQKIQSATTVEAVLQIAARELGHTLGASLTIAQLGLKEKLNEN